MCAAGFAGACSSRLGDRFADLLSSPAVAGDEAFVLIRQWGDPVLRERAREVEEFDDAFAQQVSELAQLMQDREIGIGLGQEDRLGDLQFEPLRRQAGLGQRRDRDLDQVAAAELRRRQIDRDLDVDRPFHRR